MRLTLLLNSYPKRAIKMNQSGPPYPFDKELSAQAFKAWRKRLGLSQKQAGEALGLKTRMIQYYEKGERNDEPIAIPKTVRLACQALATGILDYDGQTVSLIPEGRSLSSLFDE